MNLKMKSLIVFITLTTLLFAYDAKTTDDIKYSNQQIQVQYPESDGIRESWVNLGIKKGWGKLINVSSTSYSITGRSNKHDYSDRIMLTFENKKYITIVTLYLKLIETNITQIEIMNIIHINRE